VKGVVDPIEFGLEPTVDELAPILRRLRRDLREAARSLGRAEARYLVDTYYQVQDYRKRAWLQHGALTKAGEPAAMTAWVGETMHQVERVIAAALEEWGRTQPGAVWARQIVGIGPILAAGLAAHIDVSRQPTVGHLWAFAGLDPTRRWNPGEKRPWNNDLKVLCWKIGESFWITHRHPASYYGPLMERRKELEDERNERGLYRDQALEHAKRVAKDTDAYTYYSQGKLPPAHIHARARRWVVKLFLAHYWEHERRRLGLAVPLPYPVAYLGHPKEDLIPPAL